MNHEDSIPPSEDSLVKATELQQTLTKLLSRRKLLLSATAVTGASLLSTSKAKATNNVPVDSASYLQAENTVLESGPLIGEYNKAPGKLIVYPDGIVEKSPSDKYAYRALTLPNGLRVLLASDPKADTAAAALDVHVGHYSDPDDVPGLAHFNEHMLFLGNSKYPEEGQLEAFLSAHGGASNAYTSSEDTCYFFSVNQDALLPALKRIEMTKGESFRTIRVGFRGSESGPSGFRPSGGRPSWL